MKLTHDNYHSAEANRRYVSSHILGDFIDCPIYWWRVHHTGETAAPPPSKAMHTSGALHDWIVLAEDPLGAAATERWPQAYTKKGAPCSELAALVESWKHHGIVDQVSEMLCKSREKIITFELAGVPARAMIDASCVESRTFIDLKTTADFSDRWAARNNRNVKIPWWDAFNYYRQMAMYEMALASHTGKHEWTPIIVAVTKQSPPMIAHYTLKNRERMQREKLSLMEAAQQISWERQENVAPDADDGCGTCVACRELMVERGHVRMEVI